MPFLGALESHLLVRLDLLLFIAREEPYWMPRQRLSWLVMHREPVESPIMVGGYDLALIPPAIIDAGKQCRPAWRGHFLDRDWTGENIGAVRQGRAFLFGRSLTRHGS